MNHLKMYQEIQDNHDYSYEFRNLVKAYQCASNLQQARREILDLLQFIEQKMLDSRLLEGLPKRESLDDLEALTNG